MIEIIQKTDYDGNLDLLIQQYKEKIKFKKIIEAENDLAVQIEQALFEIRDNFWIGTAKGEQLDILGEIQGETRQGKNDTDYRVAINARILVNNGSGQFEIIITLLRDLFNITNVQIKNIGNANLYIYISELLTVNQLSQLLKTIASGVGLYIDAGIEYPFSFDPEDTIGGGFGKCFEEDETFDDGEEVTFEDSTVSTMITDDTDTTSETGVGRLVANIYNN